MLPVAAGTLRMPVRKFLAWSAIGALSWATLYVSVGATAGASFREAGENLAGATLAVFGVAALAASAVWLRDHRRRVGRGHDDGDDSPGGNQHRWRYRWHGRVGGAGRGSARIPDGGPLRRSRGPTSRVTGPADTPL